MRYIKEYVTQRIPKKFSCDDWVVPVASSLAVSSNRAYQIAGEYSPEFNRAVNKYDNWSYSLNNPESELDTRLYIDVELRKATWQEVEEEKLKREAKKYNL